MEYRKLSTTLDLNGNEVVICDSNSNWEEMPPPAQLVRTLNTTQIKQAFETIKYLNRNRVIIKSTLDYIMYIEKNIDKYYIWSLSKNYIYLFPENYFNC